MRVQRAMSDVAEVAVLVGLGRSTLYDAVARGEVRSVRVGRRILIPESEVRRLLGDVPPSSANDEASATEQ